METKPVKKRSYNSTRRKEQARLTRLQIIEAARVLFIDRGYTGATLESIALAAGVAVETVYAAFGNKRALLAELINVSLVGDDQPIPVWQREGALAVKQNQDQHRQIHLFVIDMAVIMSRVAPLFEVMRSASKTEPDIAEMLQNILAERAMRLEIFINALLANGPIQKGLSPHDAAETVWALTSGEMYTLLVKDRNWTIEKYKNWLINALTKLILP
ncbi:MAG: hypothetical protein CVU39_21625 [Chloroflexi bacterium HGW-Chloroflexi-10]|nr:MAG: hypothetical protein CVU39_21625 [Chloroflexi bacterium HGW-Chloroflexi-10]